MDYAERAQIIDSALKDFYLALPGRTLAGWLEVKKNPCHYNMLWRKALGIEVNGNPPLPDARMQHPVTKQWLHDTANTHKSA